jgi:hypothetical protein
MDIHAQQPPSRSLRLNVPILLRTDYNISITFKKRNHLLVTHYPPRVLNLLAFSW